MPSAMKSDKVWLWLNYATISAIIALMICMVAGILIGAQT